MPSTTDASARRRPSGYTLPLPPSCIFRTRSSTCMATQEPAPASGYHVSKKGKVVKDGHGGRRAGSGRKPRGTAPPASMAVTVAASSTSTAPTNSGAHDIRESSNPSSARATVPPAGQNPQPSSSSLPSVTSTFFLPRQSQQPAPRGSGITASSDAPTTSNTPSRSNTSTLRREVEAGVFPHFQY